MKKIVLLMAAAALALFMSCSNSSGGGDGSGGSGGAVNVKSDLLGKNILVKDFSKYSAIGAASSKSGASGNIAAGISANTSSDSDAEKNAHLVGQDSNGNVEDLSLETEGKGSDLNQRPLQFFRAFKRFVFFMYWPKVPETNQNSNGGSYAPIGYISTDYGKLLNSPQYISVPSGYDPKTGTTSYTYEPMFVLDKSNGKIYALDTSEGNSSSYPSSSSSKWSCLYYNTGSNSVSYSSNIADGGDRFYICYTSYNYSSSGMPSTSTINYYVLTLTDNQLQESYIVKDVDSTLFYGMYLDRFGNLFVNGGTNTGNNNVKYYIASDGKKTKINYADNLHVCNSDSSLYSVYYNSDETFTYNYSSTADYVCYGNYYTSTSSNYYLDAMQPKLCTPLFMAANGYVYQACKDSQSRTGVYKRYNANGQLEDCDWVPEESQEYYFTPDELVKEDDTAKYYFVTNNYSTCFNNSSYSANKTIENLQLFNSSGQPAKVKKYDFSTKQYISEEIPVVLKSYQVNGWFYSNSYKNQYYIYKLQFADSSKDRFTVTAIPLEGFDTSNSYYYYYGCNNYAITKKHIFFIKDGDLIAYNIENGKKDASCSRTDMIFGAVYPSEDPSKINFTATSLTNNSSVRGSIDDNGIVSQSVTTYEIKYFSPIN